MNKATLTVLIVAVLLISGCASQQPQAQSSQGRQAQATETAQPQQQAETQPNAENYLGRSDTFTLSLKQFSVKINSLAKKRLPDACLISANANHLDGTSGRSFNWAYKYYSKLQNKAVLVYPESQSVSGRNYFDVFATTKDAAVFKQEPYMPCLNLQSYVDSTDAAKVVTKGYANIALQNDINGDKTDKYEFSSADTGEQTFVNPVTGMVV